ncbi:MAG TPA: hypothetical protein VFM05_08140 [Candidatus Saccharimonadales bacterium]|nr:hypothetical protein [Candidatus Saccharimonadales bacterium]
MRSSPSAPDEEIIDILRDHARFKAKYPEELLATTRAAFIARVENQGTGREFSSQPTLTTPLEHLQSAEPNLLPNLPKVRITKKTIRKED